MRVLGKILAAVIVVLFFATSTADIITVKISSDNRDRILFSKFEFSHTGYVSVAVSSVGISSIPVTCNLSQPDPSRIGFFLVPDDLSDRYDQEFKRNPDLCVLDIKFISVLFTFRDLSPPPHSSFNQSYHVTYPGEYSLYFANCNNQSLVTMDARTELYSIDDDGTTKDYLSAGQPQPSLYFRLFLIYLCFLGFWIFISIKNRQCFQRIHLLMSVLLVMTLVHFACAVADQHDLKVTGTRHGWHSLLYIFQFMRNALFFTVIMLIGAGWCIWKPFLQGRDKFILTIVILLQVWANASCILVGGSGPYNEDWQALINKFRLIDFICCVVVFFHNLSSATDESTSSISFKEISARQNGFPVLVLIYIYYSRLFNNPLEITAALESGNYVFSVVMFYLYRPLLLEDEDLNRKGFLGHTLV